MCQSKFKHSAIDDFFKHIDRKTSGVDFFDFYGISKSMIKAENGHNYLIPFEVAPLLAGMIQSFHFAFGTDRRGHTKKDSIQIDYEKYHNYIKAMQEQVEQLEPYQQALIKNYRSYDHARVVDTFIPTLVERISVLMTMLLCYGGEQTSDTIIETIRALDSMIEQLSERHLEQKFPELSSNSLYTFEDAIAGVFCVLAGCRKEEPEQNRVSSLAWENTMVQKIKQIEQSVLASKKRFSDNESFRAEVTKRLNAEYTKFFSTHQDVIKLHDDNIKFEQSLDELRWERPNDMSIAMLSWRPETRGEVEQVIQMWNGLGEYKWLKGKFTKAFPDVLDLDTYNELNPQEKYLYDKYYFYPASYEIDFLTSEIEGTPKYRAFVDTCIDKCNEVLEGGAQGQAELHQDRHLKRKNEIVKLERDSGFLNTVQSFIRMALTPLLTRRVRNS